MSFLFLIFDLRHYSVFKVLPDCCQSSVSASFLVYTDRRQLRLSLSLPFQGLFLLIWQPPALPYRLQYSTIGRLGLNHRVRDGYGCFP